MTPVPIQPMRVLPGSTLMLAMMSFLARNTVGYGVIVGAEKRAGKRGAQAWSGVPRGFRMASVADSHPAPATVPRLRDPIVLVHGLLGFDRLGLGEWTVAHYFSNLPAVLRAAGNEVLIPCLSP